MIEYNRKTNIKEFPEWSEFPKDKQHEDPDYPYHAGMWTISGDYVFHHYKKDEIQFRKFISERNTPWTWNYMNVGKFDPTIDPFILIMEELL